MRSIIQDGSDDWPPTKEGALHIISGGTIMFCEQCGSVVPDGMKFCDQCGAPVEPDIAQPGQMPDMDQPPMQPGMMQPQGQPVPPQPMMQPQYMNRPDMPMGRMPAMSPGSVPPLGAYNTKKSPLIPIIIAVVAVLVLGLGGFGVYKNIDKIKALVAKEKEEPEEPPIEEPPVEEPPVQEPPKEEPVKEEPVKEEPEKEKPEREEPEKKDTSEEKPGREETEEPKEDQEEQDTPDKNAISGGKWSGNGTGGHIYTLNGEMLKSCWVESKGDYYYVDASGYRMSNNWSHDGFFTGDDGKWDRSVKRRRDDPEPITGVNYINKAYRDNTGECKSGIFSGSKKKNDMSVTFNYQWDDMTYNITPLGCGTYVLTDASGMLDPMDVIHTIVMSVSEDQSEILISEYGNTMVVYTDGKPVSSKGGNTSEGSGSKSGGSGSGNVTITDIVERARVKSGAPNAELDSIDPDGTLNIRLYGNGTQDTWDWYYIDPNTLKGTNITGDAVSLN